MKKLRETEFFVELGITT